MFPLFWSTATNKPGCSVGRKRGREEEEKGKLKSHLWDESSWMIDRQRRREISLVLLFSFCGDDQNGKQTNHTKNKRKSECKSKQIKNNRHWSKSDEIITRPWHRIKARFQCVISVLDSFPFFFFFSSSFLLSYFAFLFFLISMIPSQSVCVLVSSSISSSSRLIYPCPCYRFIHPPKRVQACALTSGEEKLAATLVHPVLFFHFLLFQSLGSGRDGKLSREWTIRRQRRQDHSECDEMLFLICSSWATW